MAVFSRKVAAVGMVRNADLVSDDARLSSREMRRSSWMMKLEDDKQLGVIGSSRRGRRRGSHAASARQGTNTHVGDAHLGGQRGTNVAGSAVFNQGHSALDLPIRCVYLHLVGSRRLL